jgi:hypothetical protein
MEIGGRSRSAREGSRRHENRHRAEDANGRLCRLGVLVLVPSSTAVCTITTHVEPIRRDAPEALCVKENPPVWSKEFLPALREQFERRGITTSVYASDVPNGCRHRAEYDANWSWDLTVYLVYADIRVYEEHHLIGRATLSCARWWRTARQARQAWQQRKGSWTS